MPTLVTGCAGFIGYHVTDRLLSRGWQVVGVDNLDPYYDPALKRARLARLEGREGFRFEQMDLSDAQSTRALFSRHSFSRAVHLAAQAGVRHSLTHPDAYVRSNLDAFLQVLEGCRHTQVGHLLYASSSSVYGGNQAQPFSEHHPVDHPVSLYAASKRANELMAHTYAHLFGLPCTGLRFFTVYGPWGRPDMALYIFTRAILEGRPIDVFNQGDMHRDFTYIYDIVEGVLRVLDAAPPAANLQMSAGDPAGSWAPFRLYNIGRGRPVPLMQMIGALERALGKRAVIEFRPMQPGDVKATYADVSDLEDAVGYRPQTSIEDGIARFVDWYRAYHGS